jgi:hypothetical protein
MGRIGGVNAAVGHLACSLPRNARLSCCLLPRNNNGACSTAALLFFCTLCPHFQYTHAHRVPLQQRSSRSINPTSRCLAVFSSDRHDRKYQCASPAIATIECITLLQTIIVTRSNVIHGPQSSAIMHHDHRSNVMLLCSTTINSLCRKDNRRNDDVKRRRDDKRRNNKQPRCCSNNLGVQKPRCSTAMFNSSVRQFCSTVPRWQVSAIALT